MKLKNKLSLLNGNYKANHEMTKSHLGKKETLIFTYYFKSDEILHIKNKNVILYILIFYFIFNTIKNIFFEMIK